MTLKRAIITYVCTHAYSKRNQLCPSVIQSVIQSVSQQKQMGKFNLLTTNCQL